MKTFVNLLAALLVLAAAIGCWTVGDQMVQDGKQLLKVAEGMR